MSVFEGDLSSKTYVKCPKFSGKTKDFPPFKKKASNFWSQIGCSSLLTEIPGFKFKLLTAAERAKMALDMETEKDEAKKLVMKQTLQYCQLSDKAFGYLSNCIDTSTAKGKYVYDMVTNFQDEEFPGGQFKAAWEKLCK
jgi:hypothetical protein